MECGALHVELIFAVHDFWTFWKVALEKNNEITAGS